MVIFSLVATSTHIVFKFYMLVFFDDESCLVLWPFCVVYAGLPGLVKKLLSFVVKNVQQVS